MSKYTELGLENVLEALLNKMGLQAISDAASIAMENPFWIVDINSQLLASISGNPQNEELVKESKLGYVLDSTIEYTNDLMVRKRANEQPFTFQAPNSTNQVLTCPVRIGRVTVAYISVINEQRDFVQQDFDRIMILAKIVSTEMEKDEFFRDNKEMMNSYFLTDLLNERMVYEDIPARLKVQGYKTEKYFYLLTVSLQNTENRQIKLRTISTQLRSCCHNSMDCFYQNHLVCVFSIEEPLKTNSYLVKRLTQFLNDAGLKAALSDPFLDLSNIKQQYDKTLQAIYLGSISNPDACLYTYSTQALNHALSLIQKEMCASDFANGAIDKLEDYDKLQNANLIPTLHAYVETAFKIAPTAELLNIHQNTVRQRLSKIQELTGLSLDNGYEMFELFLGLSLLTFLQP